MNPYDYLVQSPGPPYTSRRFDWLGGQASDSYRDVSGRVVQTFDFAPFGTFEAAADGGQIAIVDARGVVRFTETRDGGRPANQFFVGLGVWDWRLFRWGTGWIVWLPDIGSIPKKEAPVPY